MRNILEGIAQGRGKEGDIELLERMATRIAQTSLCALGQTAPNPVLTTIRHFREEYEIHIREGRCPAGECKALITYSIDKDACTGCTLCFTNCPVNAIVGERKQPHVIDPELCIKCGMCRTVCKFDAVKVG